MDKQDRSHFNMRRCWYRDRHKKEKKTYYEEFNEFLTDIKVRMRKKF